MIVLREGRVDAVLREWDGAVEVQVSITGGGTCRALAYPRIVGSPQVEDLVLLNTTALDRGLGTGGYAMVVAIPLRVPVDAPQPCGHLVKARYTPQQVMVQGVDEQGTRFHEAMREADDLTGMPVVVADLHSSLPAVLAGVFAEEPGARVAYVMSDGGSLPAWFSMTVAGLRRAGWLSACVSAGQAFGGDLEAVGVHSALLACRVVLGAQIAVVIQGPGNLGTGTRWGFSGVAVGEAVNAASVLGGRPVGVLRLSEADERPRHRGVSHHSLTAYGRVALRPADLVLPELAGRFGTEVREQAAALARPRTPHRLVPVPVDGLAEALERCPVRLSTMGRGPGQDPAAFLAAAAAGRWAAGLLRGPGRPA